MTMRGNPSNRVRRRFAANTTFRRLEDSAPDLAVWLDRKVSAVALVFGDLRSRAVRGRETSAQMRGLILTLAVLLAAAASTRAGVSFVLTPAVQSGVASNEVAFSGILSNTSATDNLFLNDIQFSFTGAATNVLLGVTNSFFANVPGILLPGETYSDVVVAVAINGSTPPGDYFGAVTVLGGTNIFGATSLSTQTFAVAVGQTPFGVWQLAEFWTNASNPAISGDLADPDGDGIVNLLEYALNLDPNTPGANGLPIAQVDPGCGCLTLIYTKVISATDLMYSPEAASDPGGPWSTNGITQAIIASNAVTQTIQASDTLYPLATSTNRFMHLKVTRLP
jgi:hypothetical protein